MPVRWRLGAAREMWGGGGGAAVVAKSSQGDEPGGSHDDVGRETLIKTEDVGSNYRGSH